MSIITVHRTLVLVSLFALVLGAGACKESSDSKASKEGAVKESKRERAKKERRQRRGSQESRSGDSEAGKGPSKEALVSCEALRKKNEACRKEIAEAVEGNLSQRIPGPVRDRVVSGRKDRYASERWAARCQRRWDSGKERFVKEREAMEKCLALTECDKYAKCFTDSLGRRGARLRARGADGE